MGYNVRRKLAIYCVPSAEGSKILVARVGRPDFGEVQGVMVRRQEMAVNFSYYVINRFSGLVSESRTRKWAQSICELLLRTDHKN